MVALGPTAVSVCEWELELAPLATADADAALVVVVPAVCIAAVDMVHVDGWWSEADKGVVLALVFVTTTLPTQKALIFDTIYSAVQD